MGLKKRILIIDNSVAVTGALVSALRSSRALSEKFEFFFLLPRDSRAIPAATREGFQVLQLPMRELSKSAFSWLVYLPRLVMNSLKLRTEIRRCEIDLILANDFYNLLPVVVRLLGGGTPYVTYIRFMPDRFPTVLVNTWLNLHLKFSDKVIAVSHAVHRKLRPNNKLIVIYNELPLIDVAYTKPDTERLLFLSNFTKGKGQDVALRSFAPLAKRFPQWTLRFVGGDMGLSKNASYKRDLQQVADRLGIGGQVQWGDYSDDPGSEYLACGIVLNLSDSESFSMTCLEAMYYGRCVIATRSGGPEEIIDDGVSGILVPGKDVDQITFQLERLMSDGNLRVEIGRNAYQESRRRFGLSHTVDRLEQVYLESLDRIKN